MANIFFSVYQVMRAWFPENRDFASLSWHKHLKVIVKNESTTTFSLWHLILNTFYVISMISKVVVDF